MVECGHGRTPGVKRLVVQIGGCLDVDHDVARHFNEALRKPGSYYAIRNQKVMVVDPASGKLLYVTVKN